MAAAADRNLVFGLLALQNGLIDQDQLVAAFRVWGRDKSRQIADYLVERDLAISLMMIGQLRQVEGQAVEAVEAYRKALAILGRLPRLPPYDHFNVACIHAGLAGVAARPGSGLSASEGRAEADRAMTWLRRAVGGGYRPLAQALASPVLSPLRSRPDFQLLLMDLAFPKDPFARGN